MRAGGCTLRAETRHTLNRNPALSAAAISARILNEIGNGLPLKEAFDKVLGAGRYDTMVSELYDELRAKAAG